MNETPLESQPIVIRPAGHSDQLVVEQIVRAAYGGYVDQIGKPPAPLLQDYGEVIAKGDTWVAESAGKVVGMMVLQVEPECLLLENVAVSPDIQTLGVGSKLLSFAEDEARRRQRGEIRLYTNAAMTENLEYYPRRGYVETSRAEDQGFSRVYFTKKLGGHSPHSRLSPPF